MTELSPIQARRLVLRCQGLHRANVFGSGKNGILRCLEQLGYVQIDTISVVNRAHHHTLWSRVPSYKQEHLRALQKSGKVLEYWAHAAAYLPMTDYRFCLPYMNAIASGERHWYEPDKRLMQKVFDRIKAEGPLMAKDFEPPKDRKPGIWWQWKPAKRALDQLFIEGKLMVSHRNNFHKVYDLPERVLPGGLDTTVPTIEEFYRHLIRRSIQAHGLVAEPEISYLRKGIKAGVRKQLQQMLADGEIIQISVKANATPYYSMPDIIEESTRFSKSVHLLSPFDNAVIQRKRVLQLFDFDFQIECYVPEPKRKYGYFCLPILYGAELVGRLDPKADRKSSKFLVRSLYLEKKIANVDKFLSQLAGKLLALARFNDCNEVILEKSDPPEIRPAVQVILKNG